MKRILIPSFMALTCAFGTSAQSAMDALQISQPDFKGTARFMGMGGAFTALGGDLSTLTQNPAGIGIYRHSEIGATLDINMQSTKTSSPLTSISHDQTKAFCNNFGYVGVAELGGVMNYFQWGVTYGRKASFDRVYEGYTQPTNSSLSNYIASFTDGTPSQDLDFTSSFNPYFDGSADWLSILAYTSYMINQRPGYLDRYDGLYQNGTKGDASLFVREKGFIDEYSFNFGGNFSDMIYWGLGIGVTDLSYTRIAEYSESMENAYIYNLRAQDTGGDAGYYLSNWKKITGTGWNLKFGLIFKPVNEFRIGAAIHSPTWYNIDEQYAGAVDYSYFNPNVAQGENNPLAGYEESDVADFSWRLRQPWRFMVGASAVIGSKFIISADYEYDAYPDMSMKNPYYSGYGYVEDYVNNDPINQDIKDYTQAQNIIRVGAEYRITPRLSVRAGYNTSLSNIKKELRNNYAEVVTAGTDPSFSLDGDISNISVGLGYRFGAWYIDGTYMHTSRKSSLRAFTDFDGILAPDFEIKDSNNSLVFSLGFKF